MTERVARALELLEACEVVGELVGQRIYFRVLSNLTVDWQEWTDSRSPRNGEELDLPAALIAAARSLKEVSRG